jgi:hypothetical protein
VVSRLEGLLLVAAYAVFFATIWILELQRPTLGEASELEWAPGVRIA